MSGPGFARTELEQLGSRIVYRALIKLPADSRPADLETLAEELRALLGKTGPFRVRTYVESQEEMRRALQRAARFLGLVALLSLLLGGLGIAQTTRAWLTSRTDDIAILRCLGLRPNEVVMLYLAQATILGLAGSLVGLIIGVTILAIVPYLFGEILGPATLDLWQPTVLLKGLALGLGVALLFSLRALLTVRQVPPLRVLRKDVEPLPGSRVVNLAMIVILGLGVWAVASIQAVSPIRGLQFAAGISVASALLAGVALLVMRNLAPVARRARTVWLRQGVLALARPGAATLGAVVSLGIGVLLILGLQLVKIRLSDELRGQLPENSPTGFLINIQPTQWPEVEQLLVESGAQQIDSVPIVTARLRQIDGQEISEMALDETDRDRRWALTREQRLTYMEALPEDNRIIAGALWRDPETAEVSVEEEFAGELGVEVGSSLLFDIQGVPFELQVTSLRTVEWRTFGINFFLVVEPGVLDEAPQQRVATARLPREQEQSVQDRLASRFPNITLLKIREVLERIAAMLGYLASGVGFIGAFTGVAGIVILAGGVTADSVRRRQHIALLKTLGMTQRQISAMLAVEFTVVGTIAGLIGTVGGSLLAWAVLTRGLELRWSLQPAVLAAAFLVPLLLTAVTGILASRQALRQRPAAVLRGE
jgi:putative ABC transport system permease protein